MGSQKGDSRGAGEIIFDIMTGCHNFGDGTAFRVAANNLLYSVQRQVRVPARA
jgi:hypothetical protein